MSTKEKCAEMVYHSQGNWRRSSRCERVAGHGPEGKYCGQHAEKFAAGETVTWFRVSTWTEYSCEIESVRVLKDTGESLLVKGEMGASREKKVSANYRYFGSPEEAGKFYRERVEQSRERTEQFAQKVEREIAKCTASEQEAKSASAQHPDDPPSVRS